MTLGSENYLLYWPYMKNKTTYWVQSCTSNVKVNYIWASTKDTSTKITYSIDIDKVA